MEEVGLIVFCIGDTFLTSFMLFHHSKSAHEFILVRIQHLFIVVSKQCSMQILSSCYLVMVPEDLTQFCSNFTVLTENLI